MVSVAAAFNNFISAISAIIGGLLHSVLAVAQAGIGLTQDIFKSIFLVGQNIVKLALELFQGAFGFIAGNIVAITVIGGGYYAYTRFYQNSARNGQKKVQ